MYALLNMDGSFVEITISVWQEKLTHQDLHMPAGNHSSLFTGFA